MSEMHEYLICCSSCDATVTGIDKESAERGLKSGGWIIYDDIFWICCECKLKMELCKDCGSAPVNPPPRCDMCWNKWHTDHADACMKKFAAKNSPNILPEKTGSAGPGSDHYTVNGITPMEYVKAMGQNEYRGACILNIIKYVSRYPYKGTPMKDLEKARWYIDQLIIAQGEVEVAEK